MHQSAHRCGVSDDFILIKVVVFWSEGLWFVMVPFKIPIVKKGTAKKVNIITNVILVDNVFHVIREAIVRMSLIEFISSRPFFDHIYLLT